MKKTMKILSINVLESFPGSHININYSFKEKEHNFKTMNTHILIYLYNVFSPND